MISSEYYKKVFDHFIKDLIEMLKKKNRTRSIKLKNMIIDTLEQMILFSEYHVEIMNYLEDYLIIKHKKILYAMLKKEDCLEYLINSNIIEEEFKFLKNYISPEIFPKGDLPNVENKELPYLNHLNFIYKHA